MLKAHGLTWFNPDAFSRALVAQSGVSKDVADGQAWPYGKSRLEAAIADGTDFAFETTLGGNTILQLVGAAATTHDVIMIFCGSSAGLPRWRCTSTGSSCVCGTAATIFPRSSGGQVRGGA
jgi:predicted ABC-type ATPase